ncbi:MAG: pentapeptide repeat-containing protein [Anaerolineae bacterium]|nr:pentapeptide repeat-containing protein [Anaerolineae bacterium]
MKGREVLRNYRIGERNFSRARLANAILYGADLRRADLTETNLEDADLRGANLFKAVVEQHQLDQAKYLEHVILPDGTRYGQ